jgi:hypothetical protein
MTLLLATLIFGELMNSSNMLSQSFTITGSRAIHFLSHGIKRGHVRIHVSRCIDRSEITFDLIPVFLRCEPENPSEHANDVCLIRLNYPTLPMTSGRPLIEPITEVEGHVFGTPVANVSG